MTSSLSSATAGKDAPGWRQEFAYAVAQPELAQAHEDTAAARRASYWLAVVLGHCRLEGVDLGESDGSLPGPVAAAASRRLLNVLKRCTEDVARLEQRLDEAGGEAEADDLCFQLLEARLQVWAAYVAIDEAYQVCLEDRPPDGSALSPLIDEVLAGIAELDRRMLEQLPLFSRVAAFPMLDNWRKLLAPEYRETLPWWLDGRLEGMAKEIEEASSRLLPRQLTGRSPAGTGNAVRSPQLPQVDPGERVLSEVPFTPQPLRPVEPTRPSALHFDVRVRPDAPPRPRNPVLRNPSSAPDSTPAIAQSLDGGSWSLLPAEGEDFTLPPEQTMFYHGTAELNWLKLTLRVVEETAETVRLVVEALPGPSLQPMTVVLRFTAEESRTFTIPPQAGSPRKQTSAPCDPVPRVVLGLANAVSTDGHRAWMAGVEIRQPLSVKGHAPPMPWACLRVFHARRLEQAEPANAPRNMPRGCPGLAPGVSRSSSASLGPDQPHRRLAGASHSHRCESQTRSSRRMHLMPDPNPDLLRTTDTLDPAAALVDAFKATLRDHSKVQQALDMAASSDLARAATPESAARLAAILQTARQQLPANRALLLVEMVASHAGAVAELGWYPLALTLYQKALPMLEVAAPPANLGGWKMNVAITLDHLGEFRDAVEGYDEALPLFRRHGLPADVALCLMNRANSLQHLGQLDEAVEGYDEALTLLRHHGLPADVALCLMNRANSLHRLGRLPEAVEGYDEALALFRREALALFRRHGLAADIAVCLMNRANSLHRLSRLPEAVEGYDEALTLLRPHGLPADVALCLMNRANSLHRLDRLAEAVEGYDEALPLLRCHGLPASVARCLMNRANLLHSLADSLDSLGRLGEAVEGYEEALPLVRRHGLPADVATCLANRANSLARLGQFPKAATAFEAVDPDSLPAADRIKYHANFARTLRRLDQTDRALEQYTLYRHALRQARRTSGIDDTDLQFINQLVGWLSEAVRCALDSGNLPLAFATVQDGKACLFGDLRESLLDLPLLDWPELDTARRLVVQAVLTGRPSHEPFAEYHRAVRQALRAACPAVPVTGTSLSPTDFLARVQAALPPGWALLDFWQLDQDALAVFVLTAAELRVVHLRPFERAPRLLRQIVLYLDFLSDLGEYLTANRRPEGWAEADVDHLWDDLYDALFADLLPLLTDITGLYLVPHGPWHQVPLHAARWLDRQQRCQVYLADRFTIAYLPSAALLPDLPGLQLDGPALSLANPDRETPLTLPFAEWEAQQLEALVRPRGSFHAGPKATTAPARCWDQAAILHLGCHGASHPTFAPLSHLRLAGDLLLAHDVAYRLPPLRRGALVVLNACQTAVRDHRALDENMGLMTAFLLRGAGVVLATAYSVNDHYASEVVAAFLRRMLRDHLSPSQALAQAQQQARSMADQHTQDRCRELLALFPEDRFPHEARKVRAAGLRAALRARRYDDAREHARHLAVTLRRVGADDEASRLETVLREGRADLHGATDSEEKGEPCYHTPGCDDPVYWGAFQLIGRVT